MIRLVGLLLELYGTEEDTWGLADLTNLKPGTWWINTSDDCVEHILTFQCKANANGCSRVASATTPDKVRTN